MKAILHALAFQGVWLVCLLGAARGASWPGVAAALVFLGLTLARSPRRRAELRLVLQVALLGTLCDSLVASAGVLSFAAPSPLWPERLAPLWLSALWASFATLTPRSLSWLQTRPGLALVLGALSGPLTYASAIRLGAGEWRWADPQASLAVALEYALALPLALALCRRALPPEAADSEETHSEETCSEEETRSEEETPAPPPEAP